jgi:hypothetical protein
MNWAWRQDVPSTPKLVLLALADASDDEGRCWPSVAKLSVKASASTRTVRRAIQLLIDQCLITAEPRYRPDGTCSSNTYRLTMQGGDKLSSDLSVATACTVVNKAPSDRATGASISTAIPLPSKNNPLGLFIKQAAACLSTLESDIQDRSLTSPDPCSSFIHCGHVHIS